jgi:hypothetical protein
MKTMSVNGSLTNAIEGGKVQEYLNGIHRYSSTGAFVNPLQAEWGSAWLDALSTAGEGDYVLPLARFAESKHGGYTNPQMKVEIAIITDDELSSYGRSSSGVISEELLLDAQTDLDYEAVEALSWRVDVLRDWYRFCELVIITRGVNFIKLTKMVINDNEQVINGSTCCSYIPKKFVYNKLTGEKVTVKFKTDAIRSKWLKNSGVNDNDFIVTNCSCIRNREGRLKLHREIIAEHKADGLVKTVLGDRLASIYAIHAVDVLDVDGYSCKGWTVEDYHDAKQFGFGGNDYVEGVSFEQDSRQLEAHNILNMEVEGNDCFCTC